MKECKCQNWYMNWTPRLIRCIEDDIHIIILLLKILALEDCLKKTVIIKMVINL